MDDIMELFIVNTNDDKSKADICHVMGRSITLMLRSGFGMIIADLINPPTISIIKPASADVNVTNALNLFFPIALSWYI